MTVAETGEDSSFYKPETAPGFQKKVKSKTKTTTRSFKNNKRNSCSFQKWIPSVAVAR